MKKRFFLAYALGDRFGLLLFLTGFSFSALAQSPSTLPVEVIGPDGYVAAVRFTLDDATGVDGLYLQVHRPAYRDALTNPERGAKASVQLNGGNWIELNNETAEVAEPEASYGGLGGGFHTVRLTLPIQGAVSGLNTLRFRFNGTDGITSGYRVLDFNLLAENQKLLADTLFVPDDPTDWQPPLSDAQDIAQGKLLWQEASLVDYPGGPTIRATCADCHAQDGRDLEYFAYSNRSIEERAKFHGLDSTQAQQITSYIRGLKDSEGIERLGRPWNPPYQPGPGLDSRPVTHWAAGAGLEAVLEQDTEALPYLFPMGTSEEEIATVSNARGTLNVREIPLALQFPDWNDWLPLIHPKDAWPDGSYENSAAWQGYLALRERFEQEGTEAIVASGELPDLLGGLEENTQQFVTAGSAQSSPPGYRTRDGHAAAALKQGLSFERAVSYLVRSSAVKQWEIVQEFGLEDQASLAFDNGQGEPRAWPSRANAVFQIAPHIVADNLRHFTDQDQLAGYYASTIWYQLQMTLNAGQKQETGEKPIDWPYQLEHISYLAENSGVLQPVRYTASLIKAYQEKLNGRGSGRGGFELRFTHPWRFYADARNVTSHLDDFETAEAGLRNKVVEALLTEFLNVVINDPDPSFRPENWARTTHDDPNGVRRWYSVEPADYVPVPYSGEGKLFAFPENYHADNFFRLIPLLEANSVDVQLLSQLVDWCQRMWPQGDWDALLAKEPKASGVITLLAKGDCGEEVMELRVDSVRVATWSLDTTFTTYTYSDFSGGEVSVHFVNDHYDPEQPGCPDRNLTVSWLEVCGTRYSTEAVATKSTDCCAWDADKLYNQGSFTFGKLGCSSNPAAAAPLLLSVEAFKAYPNPASETLTVQGGQDYQVEVYDLMGRPLMQHPHLRGKETLDVSHLRPGIYLLKLQNAEGQSSEQRIIIR